MPRTADIAARLVIRAGDLHIYDYLIFHDGSQHTVMERPRKRNARVTVELDRASTHTVAVDYPVTVAAEHPCDCDGTGRFRWAGRVENGQYIGQEGPHFACNGKGWQDRSDVIRNSTYWAKYARIYA